MFWALAHLAFMPNPENRITLLFKWLVAVVSQQRSSMLLTGMPNQHLNVDAPDAHFPMLSGQGPSIAEPDAALKAAINYYSRTISGVTTQPIDPKDGSEEDSTAAIK